LPLLVNHKTATHLVTDEHEKQHLKKKHTLYSIGQRTFFLYYVEKGKIKEFLISEEGKELITGIYSEGDYFGYTEILLGTNYKRSSKVIEDATLSLIPKQEFLDKMNTHPATAQFFIKLLSNQVVENGEILINMAYHSLRKNVASAIIRITDKFKDTF
jgi:CRP-like cAMP-binding protein